MGRSAFSRGSPASIWAVFINLGGECAKEGVHACEPDFADLALCFAFPVSVSLEGQMTLSRRLPLMKTAQILAGLPDIWAHPGIGAARDELPSPCLIAWALLRRPLAMDSHRVYRSAYGNRAALLSRSPPWRLSTGAPIPIPACRFAQSRLESIGPLCAPSSRWCPHNEKQAEYKGVPWFPTRCRE